LFGAQEAAIVGKTDDDFVSAELAAFFRRHDLAAMAAGGPTINEETLTFATDGYQGLFETTKMPMLDAQGGIIGVLGIARDITERRRAEQATQTSASVFTHAREGIMITDAASKILDVNAAFTRITGSTREDVVGKNPRILSSGRQPPTYYETMWAELQQAGFWTSEVWNRRKNGEVFAELQTISAVHDSKGQVQQYVSLFSDISAFKEHEFKLEHIAHYDALTNLPNRVLMADRLHQTISQRHGQVAVVFFDLDGFKSINDRFGHEAGDHLLITLAQRLKAMLREGDTLARMGGDEFAVVLQELDDTSACVPLLNRMLATAAEPVQFGTDMLQVSASAGVTFYPQAEDVDGEQLLRQADQAMYQAKLAGKNRFHVFDAVQERSMRGYHESVERIRRALTEREFVLHYQPQVNMRTGQVVGMEALIRWQHPQRGLLSPAAFLPLIENHVVAIGIGEWVIDAALAQLEQWGAAGMDLPVSVNIGASQLQQANFVERVAALLAAHPTVAPSRLEMEVLETSALEDVQAASQVIEECKRMGVLFALDDFGTGYSSLTYLKRLPVALLKIDQSFVRDMLGDSSDLAILEGIIGLATAFRRKVIAEGVETVQHGTRLLEIGCDLAQGYGIARPMPASEVPAWVAQWRPDPAWV
jgi:diguanylate cyclase (GGDEF)-like protein/PAS domain S-box-containing protein